MVLRPSRRFAHSSFYIEDLLARNDFICLSVARHPIRLDRGAPIEGYIVVARKRSVEDIPLPEVAAREAEVNPVL